MNVIAFFFSPNKVISKLFVCLTGRGLRYVNFDSKKLAVKVIKVSTRLCCFGYEGVVKKKNLRRS